MYKQLSYQVTEVFHIFDDVHHKGSENKKKESYTASEIGLKLAYFNDNRYLTSEQSTFVDLVIDDLKDFHDKTSSEVVLLFPPVNSFLRLLIHKSVEDFPDLHSFSVGQDDRRQSVVCWKSACIERDNGQLRSVDYVTPWTMRGRGRARYRDQNSQSPRNRQGPGDRWNHDSYQSESLPLVQPRYSQGDSHPRNTPGHTMSGKQMHTSQERYSSDGIVEGSRTQSPVNGSSNRVRKSDRSKNRRPDAQVYVPKARRQQPGQNDNLSVDPDESPGPSSNTTRRTRQKRTEMEHYVPKGRQTHRSQDSDKVHVFDDISGGYKSDVKVSDCCNSRISVSDEDFVQFSVGKVEIQTLRTSQDEGGDKVEPNNGDCIDMCGTQSYNKTSELNDTNNVNKESMCSNQEQFARDLSRQGLQLNSDNVNQDIKNENIESNWFTNKISINSITEKSDPLTENRTNEEGKSVEENMSHNHDLDQALCDKSEHSSNDSTEPNAACDKMDLQELCKDDTNDFVTVEVDHIGATCLDVPLKTVQCDIQTTQPQDSNLDIANNSETASVIDNSAKEMDATDDIVIHNSKDFNHEEIVNALSDDNQSFNIERSDSEKLNNVVSNDINATSNLEESSETTQEIVVNKSEVARCETENTAETDDDRCEMTVNNGDDLDRIDNVEQLIDEPTIKYSSPHDNVDQEEKDELSESVDAKISCKNMQNSELLIDEDKESSSQSKCVTSNNNQSQTEEVDEDSWDAMFDDDGECLDPSAMDELTKTVGEVKIKKSKKINYLEYQPKDKSDFDYTNYEHIIEIYDFPAEFVTRDLIMAFQNFMSRGFDLKWVDDTHALGIFSSAIAAQDALGLVHPLLKVCPLSQASKQSKIKAKRCTEFLQPYKPRPETSAAAARRLVAGALGIATNVSREKRDKERQQLKEAKAKRRKDRQNREDIWEFGKCAMDEES